MDLILDKTVLMFYLQHVVNVTLEKKQHLTWFIRSQCWTQITLFIMLKQLPIQQMASHRLA